VSFPELSRELKDLFAGGIHADVSDTCFNDLALRVFRYQCETNPLLDAFTRWRGSVPAEMTSWESIPAVPTRAFKSLPLVSGDATRVERVFRTSGTTRGPARRGEHHVVDLSLYRASLLPTFEAFLIPDGTPLTFLCLAPSPDQATDSSLSYMLGEAAKAYGEGAGQFFWHAGGGIDAEGFRAALLRLGAEDRPVLIAGTAFAFVHFLEVAASEGWRFDLSEGSRILETGGFKGGSRVMPRGELYQGLQDHLGIPESFIVSEYGMTELLSQFYEPVMQDPERFQASLEANTSVELGATLADRLARRFHRGPPWVRTRVLSPTTLEPVPRGEAGVLAHVDLANLGSVVAVLTEDLGQEVDGGFRLQGRTPGAEPRGCSLALEDFLQSAGGVT
jgi:hypothetical protein